MQFVRHTINRVNHLIAIWTSWAILLMVLFMAYSVVSRYLFNSTSIWQTELVRYLHSMVFLSVAAYALRQDSHVRVDVLYQHFSDKTKAVVNAAGALLLLLPFVGTIFYYSFPYVMDSWSILEGSREYQGLPGIFLIKSFILFFAITLGLQAIVIILESFLTLIRKET